MKTAISSIYCLFKADSNWDFLVDGEVVSFTKHNNFWEVIIKGIKFQHESLFTLIDTLEVIKSHQLEKLK